jgi:hypoxanthine phosphoribosyltransferase
VTQTEETSAMGEDSAVRITVLDTVSIAGKRLQGPLHRRVVACLATGGKAGRSKEQIADSCWDCHPKKLAKRVNATLSDLRAKGLTIDNNETVRLSEQGQRVDLWDFNIYCHEAAAYFASEELQLAYERALMAVEMVTYESVLLDVLNVQPESCFDVEAERADIQRRYREAARTMLSCVSDRDMAAQALKAIGTYRPLINQDPRLDDLLAKTLAGIGQFGDAEDTLGKPLPPDFGTIAARDPLSGPQSPSGDRRPITWQEVGTLFDVVVGRGKICSVLGHGRQLGWDDWMPEVIVGINRGGAILGGMIAKRLSMSERHGLVHVVRRDRYGGVAAGELLMPEGTKSVSRVLIADDGFLSGKHAIAARKAVMDKYGEDVEIRLAVFLFVDPRPLPEDETGISEEVLPNYYGAAVPMWSYRFPWSPDDSPDGSSAH